MSKYRLLVIEDDKRIADLVSRVAIEANFDVRATSDFTEIYHTYETFLPDVIVLDIIMPDMDGFEVLNYLHKLDSPSKVIILSGEDNYRSMAERMAQGLDLSIAATVRKPFRITEFRQTLQQVKLSLPPLGGEVFSESA